MLFHSTTFIFGFLPILGRMASGIRTQRDDGFRSHATNFAGRSGKRDSNQAKCRSSSCLDSLLKALSSSAWEMWPQPAAARRQSVAHAALELASVPLLRRKGRSRAVR